MKSRIKFTCFSIILVFLITGCWDKVELENRGFAISVGVDKLEQQNTENSKYPNRYEITISVPKLSSFASKGGGGDEKDAKMIKKNLAPTVPGGMVTANETTSERLDYSHTKVIVFGSELLKDEILFREALDGLERIQDINRKILVLATGSKAEKIFSAKSGNQPLIGLFVSDFYENNTKKSSSSFKQNLEKLLVQLKDNGCAILPRIEVKDEQIALEGAALIKDFKLVGWLSAEEVTQLLFLRQEGMGVELLTPFKDILLKARVLKQTADFEFSEIENKLKMTINIDVKAEIEEYIMSDKSLFDSQLLKQFGDMYEKELNSDIENTLNSVKEQYNTDFFHFEKLLNKKDYKLWQKYSQNWNATFKNMEIEVSSDVNIKNLGITK